jgi:hypothetical protein
VKGITSILENSAVNNQIIMPSKGGNETTNTSDINLTERMKNDELLTKSILGVIKNLSKVNAINTLLGTNK